MTLLRATAAGRDAAPRSFRRASRTAAGRHRWRQSQVYQQGPVGPATQRTRPSSRASGTSIPGYWQPTRSG